MELLIATCSVVFFLVIWFQTEAVVEYGRLIGLGGKYFEERDKDFSITSFPVYLEMKYANFFTRMLLCPFCIGFWLTIIACLLTGCNFYVVYVLSMLVYHVQVLLIKYS